MWSEEDQRQRTKCHHDEKHTMHTDKTIWGKSSNQGYAHTLWNRTNYKKSSEMKNKIEILLKKNKEEIWMQIEELSNTLIYYSYFIFIIK